MRDNPENYYRLGPAVWLRNYCVALLLVCACAVKVSAQDFNLSVTKTDAYCPGGGAMVFSVENSDTAYPVNFKVYTLPNTTDPISNNSSYSISGLPYGNYLVVASQTINGNTVSDQETVVIEDFTVPLEYTVAGDNAYCGPDGSITVTVTSGTAATYEIISGPVTRVAQPTSTFNNLPAGTYVIRVVDNCGSGEVTTFILVSDGPVLVIDTPLFPDQMLPACDQLTVQNAIASGNGVDIAYPLQAVFTVYPPGGGSPFVYNQTISGGGEQEAQATMVIPFYYDTDYYYDLTVTDPCGTLYHLDHVLIHQKLVAVPAFDDLGCGFKSLIITPLKYMPPYTIEFIEGPAGFDPAMFNSQHPGPFADSEVQYGSIDNPMPFGEYKFTLTDGCGHTGTTTTEYVEPDVEPVASVFNADCTGSPGRVEIGIAGFIIGTATVTEAPDEYEFELPHDVSQFVDPDDGLKINDLPVGEYTVILIDTCGNTWPPVHFEIEQSPGSVSPALARPDCSPGRGAVTLNAAGGLLELVQITAAPTAFTQPLPYDVTYNVSTVDHVFYMDDLPPGAYTFTINTTCETGVVRQVTITGYATTVNEFEMTRHCGSFDLEMHHTTNAVAFLSFWLQKYNPATNTWGHPDTGVSAPAGPAPFDATNALALTNNSVLPNQMQTGQFRVMKQFQSFPSGSVSTRKFCAEQIHEFGFFDDLQITNIFSLTCSGAIGDVEVEVEGVSPLNFELISKNGDDTYYLDNGDNNVFNGLESAYYKVRVTDPCGNLRTQTFNVADLPSLVTAIQPDDLELCDEGADGVEAIDLLQFDAIVRGAQDPAMVAITYHISQQDADSGQNPLPSPYSTSTATLYARAVYNNISACTATTSFDITIHSAPVLHMDDILTGCEGTDLTIEADPGYYSYDWSNGQHTSSITVSEAGSYKVIVTNEFGCSTEKIVAVSFSPIPSISHIETEDWTDTNNVITVVMDNPSTANFEYSLDGVNYQQSNTFSGLLAGPYTVYVRDLFNCGSDKLPAFLLTYPKFFTPNGDGVNETWRIRFSVMEPEMLVYIYDRYGKLITGFGADDTGWDGTLNGYPLPSTDYWFVVKRQNGEEMKGHFSMIR